MKIKRAFLIILISLLVIVFVAIGVVYYKFYAGNDYISGNINENINIILPKSETFKVTSTAKGDNQSKLARIGDTVYTFYLDNSGCTDAMAQGNDKSMRLLQIDKLGNVTEFDSIPVWMHGNILADTLKNKIYVTTYEEENIGGSFYPSVKVYTYSVGTEISRISVTTLADEKIIPYEANPRVGAEIDEFGNIAVAFSNYTGIMFVHVFNTQTETWHKHSIEYYHDTYINDCVLYPYVRLKGLDCIKIISNRDSSVTENGEMAPNLSRDYSRYFSFNGNEWEHFIIGDLRGKYEKKEVSSAPLDLYIDSDFNTHIITMEHLNIRYYIINPENQVSQESFKKFKNQEAILFVRISEMSGDKYFVVSGIAIKGFTQTGYVEVYDSNYNLLYRNNSICKSPYVYINKIGNESYLDIMAISRDKEYRDNNDTIFITLLIES